MIFKAHTFERLKPMISSAVGRRDAIVAQVSDLALALGIPRVSLDSDLGALLADATRNDVGTNEGKSGRASSVRIFSNAAMQQLRRCA
jgi:hypothetical protein